MNLRRVTSASVAAVAIGAAALAATPAVAVAQPGQQCRFGDCQGPGDHGGPGGPGGPRWDAPSPPPRDLAWRGIDQGRYDHRPFN